MTTKPFNRPAPESPVNVYSFGLCYASVCAPTDMEPEAVIEAVNASHPTGLDHGWKVADEPFSSGEPNPFDAGDCGRHWLLVC